MAYRCPYCRQALETLPPRGHCPGCGRFMHVPGASAEAEADRQRRRRTKENIVRDAKMQREAAAGWRPDPRALYGPRVLFGVLAALGIVGILVSGASDKAAMRSRTAELPHRRALRQLDTLATALGRYRFHTGAWPTHAGGLSALVSDPGVSGWVGPYVSGLRPDPWDTPYRYDPGTGGVVRLFSCGPDRQPGTPDDLTPDPAAFDVGTDWTNGWVEAPDRLPGVRIIRPTPPPNP